MKKVFLTEKQCGELGRLFNRSNLLTESLSTTPISSLDDVIVSKLLSDRVKDATSCFKDDIASVDKERVMSTLFKLMEKCRRHEEKIRPELEKICFNTLLDLFDIPDGIVDFECNLKDSIDPGHQFHMSPGTNEDTEEEYGTYDEVLSERDEIEKRKLIQSLYIGASISLYKSSVRSFIADVFALDEELPYLYSKIMGINDFIISTSDIKNTDKSHNQGGFSTVRIGKDDEETVITVEAVLFPILLVESIRGFMELFASYGLPDDIHLVKKVLDKADTLEDEPWYMKFGPALWNRLVICADGLDTKDIPYFFKRLVEMPSGKFIRLMQEVAYLTKEAKRTVPEILDRSRHEAEYNKFLSDFIDKQDSKTLLVNEYFRPEELEEGLDICR